MIAGIIIEMIPTGRSFSPGESLSYGWPPKHFSRLQLELELVNGGTLGSLEQTDVPETCLRFIEAGWYQYYWIPLGGTQCAVAE
jgi:hypothetical protein